MPFWAFCCQFTFVFVLCFSQEITHFFSRILNINLLKVWDFANFANVKIDGFCWNCISCLAELYSVHELLVMILFTWSQRKIKLSLGLPESCTASLLCKLVLDLQIKVSDHLGCQGSSSWEIESAYIYLRLLWLYKISIYSYKTGSQQFWSDFFGAGEGGWNPSIYQFCVDTYDYTFCMMKSNPVWLPHLYPAIVPKSFFNCSMLSFDDLEPTCD